MEVDISQLWLKEVPEALVLARDMHVESPTYKGVEFNTSKVHNMLEASCNAKGDLTCRVARVGGRVVGGYIAVVHTHFFTDVRYVAELALFVDKQYRATGVAPLLVEDLEAWSRGKGAAYVSVGVSTGIANDKIAGLYRKLGFEDCAISLMKELDNV